MKHNHWIDPIKRMFIPRPTKQKHKRFDMAERTSSFPDQYFSRFMRSIVQEDFITYPWQCAFLWRTIKIIFFLGPKRP